MHPNVSSKRSFLCGNLVTPNTGSSTVPSRCSIGLAWWCAIPPSLNTKPTTYTTPTPQDRNKPQLHSSHLQIGLVGGEGKVIDKNRGRTRGVLQSHMDEYGIRWSFRAISKWIAFLESAQKGAKVLQCSYNTANMNIERVSLDFALFPHIWVQCIFMTYLNESPFKYHISILGWGWGVWGHAYFAYSGGVQNSGKPAYIILACSLSRFNAQNNSVAWGTRQGLYN